MKLHTACKILAYNVLSHRHEKAMTQEEMAEHFGISSRLYQKIESGTANPTLLTIEKIANGLSVNIETLLALERVQILCDAKRFLEFYKEVFEHAQIGVGVRDYDGRVLYANPASGVLQGRNYPSFPIDIYSFLPTDAQSILRSQLNCEKNGLATSYTNYSKINDDEQVYLKYYPTLIYTYRNSTPVYSSVFITKMEHDCKKQYNEYGIRLLQAIEMAGVK